MPMAASLKSVDRLSRVDIPYCNSRGALQVDNSGLYLTATDTNAVVAFKIDPNSGALSPVPGSPFPIGATPSTMTVVRTP
jgi:6-phosphogluconolactonase